MDKFILKFLIILKNNVQFISMFINLSGYVYSVVKSTAWQIRILSSMMMKMKTLELETMYDPLAALCFFSRHN